jgi:hypothetical protein
MGFVGSSREYRGKGMKRYTYRGPDERPFFAEDQENGPWVLREDHEKEVKYLKVLLDKTLNFLPFLNFIPLENRLHLNSFIAQIREAVNDN